MIPAGYHIVPTRALLYQHCTGHDPELLRISGPAAEPYAVWCPVCEHTVKGSTSGQAVAEWNEHCIARISVGRPQ